jgi:SAM-dependent methyltransferase
VRGLAQRTAGWVLACAVASAGCGRTAVELYEPTIGMEGRDAIWVPTPPSLVELMLDLAAVGPDDLVMDLGSGDGRNIIAAAQRGVRGIGVEYNPDLVTYSARLAREAGVGNLATFVQGDMYVADLSEATVLALFLLPENMERLTPNFLAMRPGSRIVVNTFRIPGWEPDEAAELDGDCDDTSWCTALLWIVPADVGGRWQLEGGGELQLVQTFQKVIGTLTRDGRTTPLTGSLRGAHVVLQTDEGGYAGEVSGDRMEGTILRGGRDVPFVATRMAGQDLPLTSTRPAP